MSIDHRQRSRVKRILRGFPVILLLCGLVISGASSILALRANYLGAAPLIEAVFKADAENGNTEKALYDLRAYTYSHMNVNLSRIGGAKPPIQLKNRYEQLKIAETKRVALTNDIALKQGENTCGQRFPDSAQRIAKTQCVQEYLLQNGTREKDIPDALYKFDFISPRWSPDVAGFSIVFFFSCVFLLIFRLVAWFFIRRQ